MPSTVRENFLCVPVYLINGWHKERGGKTGELIFFSVHTRMPLRMCSAVAIFPTAMRQAALNRTRQTDKNYLSE